MEEIKNETLQITNESVDVSTEATPEVAPTVEDEIPSMMSSNDIMEISQSIEQAKDQIKQISEITTSLLTMTYECTDEDASNFYQKMVEMVSASPDKQLEEFTDDEKTAFFRNEEGVDYINEEGLASVDDAETMDEYRSKMFDELYSSAKEEYTQIGNLLKIEEEFKAKRDAQFKYLNSKEYQEKKEKSYQELAQKINEETDPEKKAVLQKSYDFLTSLKTFDYLFARLTNNKDSEVKNILDMFFDSTRSKYVLTRYYNKFAQLKKNKHFGVDAQSIFYFMHLECKLLPEEYYPMDNFFLFNVIKFIAYIDVSKDHDLIFVQNILLNLKKLFYHEFPTVEDENTFIKVITDYEDNFMEYIDKFKSDNTSYTEYMAEDHAEPAPAEDAPVDDKHETEKTLFTTTNSEGKEFVVTKVTNDDGFKLFVNGYPIIKPSELNPQPTTVCYAYTLNDDQTCVIDTHIDIDEFREKLEIYDS